jgi:uncharacterized protein YpuA (DUF1002 family)
LQDSRTLLDLQYLRERIDIDDNKIVDQISRDRVTLKEKSKRMNVPEILKKLNPFFLDILQNIRQTAIKK